MKTTIRYSVLIIAGFCLFALPSFGQSTNTTGFLSNVQTIFGLYNTNVDFYGTDTNEIYLQTGLSYSSADPGIKQEIEPQFFHRLGGDTNSSTWLGAGVNLDTLGQNSSGNAMDGFGAHGYFKYASHNLAGFFGVGYNDDEDAHRNDIEAGFGFEAFLSKNAGLFAKFWLGTDPNTSSVAKGPARPQVDDRIVAGANFKF